jgi:hypothetical protein
MASPTPALNSELARAFAARFLAMPVLGGPAAVRAGQAAYLPGGEGSVAGRLAPLSSLGVCLVAGFMTLLDGSQSAFMLVRGQLASVVPGQDGCTSAHGRA